LAASGRLSSHAPGDRDERYDAACGELLTLRQKPCGEPYGLPWFVVLYRAWLAFARGLPGFVASGDATEAEQDLRFALFALGVGSEPAEVPAFLDAFARLPWETPANSIAAVDERAIAFLVLVYLLSQAAVARGQRVRLQQPAFSCFVSYARADEAFARDLVTYLEAKGTDVWLDLHALTLGAPLDEALRSAVRGARVLFHVSTPAADRSAYVRMEVETATRAGLRVERLPAAAPGPDRDALFASALAHLQRSPADQLAWLRAHPAFGALTASLAQARADVDRGRDGAAPDST
jgi:hypothetical protein